MKRRVSDSVEYRGQWTAGHRLNACRLQAKKSICEVSQQDRGGDILVVWCRIALACCYPVHHYPQAEMNRKRVKLYNGCVLARSLPLSPRVCCSGLGRHWSFGSILRVNHRCLHVGGGGGEVCVCVWEFLLYESSL